jgi:hypothetical protein
VSGTSWSFCSIDSTEYEFEKRGVYVWHQEEIRDFENLAERSETCGEASRCQLGSGRYKSILDPISRPFQ